MSSARRARGTMLERHYNWRGGRTIHSDGYVMIMCADHPRASGGYVLEHILIVESVLGKPFPRKHQVHHIDRDGTNNVHNNLVVCESDGYHKLLHVREKAFRATGNPTARRCKHCKRWDSADRLNARGNHRRCANEYLRRWWRRKQTEGES